MGGVGGRGGEKDQDRDGCWEGGFFMRWFGDGVGGEVRVS